MEYKLFFKTPKNLNFFNGYYDKSPVSIDGKFLLAMKVDFIDRLPTSNDKATIGFFNLNSNKRKFNKIGITNAFNWQQGSMLSWVGTSSRYVIFNKLIGKKFKSVMVDVHTLKNKTFENAIYSISKKGDLALCVDFERHYWVRRGYSYDGIYNSKKNCNIYFNDGIVLMNLDTNKSQKIVSILSLIENKKIFSMKNSSHYIEHLMFSPSGKKFAFFHRWKDKKGQIYTRLYTYEFKNKLLKLIHDTGRISHYCWIDNDSILAFGNMKYSIASIVRKFKTTNFILSFILPIYKLFTKVDTKINHSKMSTLINGDSYFSINITNGSKRSFLEKTLTKDGHPTFFKNKNYFLTDTYPDKKNQANLIIANTNTNNFEKIATLNSIKKFDNTPLRCDLHPKLSSCEKFIAIDTMHEGYRSIFLYKR